MSDLEIGAPARPRRSRDVGPSALEQALQSLMERQIADLNRARDLMRDLPRPELALSEREAGERQVRYWRTIFNLGPDATVPVAHPRDMKRDIEFSVAGQKRTPQIERTLKVLAALEQEGWEACCVPEIVAGTVGTYYVARKYLVRHAVNTLDDALARIDAPGVRHTAAWGEQMARVKGALAILDRYPPDPDCTRRTDRQSWGQSHWHRIKAVLERHPEIPNRQRTGKRSALDRLLRVKDWRQRFFDAALATPHGDALAVLMASGCRPLELVHGVEITLRAEGEIETINLHIPGVKVREGRNRHDEKGQPHRDVEVLLDAPESRHLADLARRHGGRVTVAFHDPKISPNANATRLKGIVYRLGLEALPESKVRMSPYVFRHAFSAALKRQRELDLPERSKAMGHLSMLTIKGYGISWQRGKSRGPTVVGAAAAKPVRSAPRDTLKTQGRLKK